MLKTGSPDDVPHRDRYSLDAVVEDDDDLTPGKLSQGNLSQFMKRWGNKRIYLEILGLRGSIFTHASQLYLTALSVL